MSDTAIRVERLSKQYRIGGRGGGYKTLRDTLTETFTAPFRAFRSAADRNGHETFWALKEISFEVAKGEVIGVIGRNGAGKSTLLKILSRITEPSEGYADITGRIGSLLEVGTGFHPELSGRENIYLNGAILGMRRAEIERNFDEIVAFAEVEKFIDTPVKHYSSGMYLRLAFAVAAHLEPEILLVDEVLAVGDAAFQRKCLGKMSDVARQGRTVLLVSHDMTAISHLASRVLLLEKGEVARIGPPEDVIAYYAGQQSAEQINLRERNDRTGDGVIRLDALRFCDAMGQTVEQIASGEPLKIVVSYTSDLDRINAEELVLYLRLTDSMGHPVTALATSFCKVAENTVLPGRGELTCTIPQLLLTEEVYAIDTWLSFRGGLSDYVLRAAELPVLASNFFGTGHFPVKRKHGPVIILHQWFDSDRVSSPTVREGLDQESSTPLR
ncbi:MAG: ABC transporter ATP-binding protein, partial [Blastocatellia bacterium]